MKGFTLGLALKQRRKATRKSPIGWSQSDSEVFSPDSLLFLPPKSSLQVAIVVHALLDCEQFLLFPPVIVYPARKRRPRGKRGERYSPLAPFSSRPIGTRSQEGQGGLLAAITLYTRARSLHCLWTNESEAWISKNHFLVIRQQLLWRKSPYMSNQHDIDPFIMKLFVETLWNLWIFFPVNSPR